MQLNVIKLLASFRHKICLYKTNYQFNYAIIQDTKKDKIKTASNLVTCRFYY